VFVLTAPETIGPRGFFVDVVAIGFSDEPMRPQRATLYADGQRLGLQNVDPGSFYVYRFEVPRDAVKPGQPVRFTFDLPDARRSLDDERVLGIGVQEIRIVQ